MLPPNVFEDLPHARELLVAGYDESVGVQFDEMVSKGIIISLAQYNAQQSVQADVCQGCGATFAARAKFCHHCGKRR